MRAGNRTDGSASFAVPDTTPPAFGSPEPAAGSTIGNGDVLSVSVAATDDGSGIDPASIDLRLDGTAVEHRLAHRGCRARGRGAAAARWSPPPRPAGRRPRRECRAPGLGRHGRGSRRDACEHGPYERRSAGRSPGHRRSRECRQRCRGASRPRSRRLGAGARGTFRQHEGARGPSSACKRVLISASCCACAALSS